MSSLSYWHTPQKEKFIWITLSQSLDDRAKEFPDHEAYVVQRSRQAREACTFKELADQSASLAVHLKKMGLQKGDRVVLTGIASISWIVTVFACLRLGLQVMKCRMSKLTKEGLETIVNINHVKGFFFHPGENFEFQQQMQTVVPEMLQQEDDRVKMETMLTLDVMMSVEACQGISNIPCVKNWFNASEDEIRNVKADQCKVQPDDIAVVFMTSGSTGTPKLTPHSHFAIVNYYNLEQTDIPRHLKCFNDRSLTSIASDLFRAVVKGTINVYVQPLTAASELDFSYSLQVMREENCKVALLPQYMLHDLLDGFEIGKEEPIELEFVISGGEILQYDLFKRASKYVKRYIISYGSTEALDVALTDKNDDLQKQLKYAGKVPQGVEVKIINKANEVVPLGSPGEICMRSQLACKSYLQKESKGALIDSNGWLHMGDAGIMYDQGYIKVLGRMRTVICRGITITYPAVVEEALSKCPGVVLNAVVGVPDKRLGEDIVAFVKAKEGMELDEHILKKHFDTMYRTDEGLGITPGYFFLLDKFPLGATGKLDKNALKDLAVTMVKEVS